MIIKIIIIILFIGGQALANKWEYDVKNYTPDERMNNSIKEELNIMGKDGWEAISIQEHEGSSGYFGYTTVYFRKEIK